MTEVKEVEQNCEDRPESIDNGTVAMKESEMGEEKPREDKIEAEGVEETQVKSKDDDGEDEQTEESGNEEDAEEKKSQSQVVDGSDDGRKGLHVDGSREKSSDENIEIPVDAAENGRDLQTDNVLSMDIDEDHDAPVDTTENELVSTHKSPVNDEQGPAGQDTEEENGVKLDVCDSLNDKIVDETISRTYTGSSPDTQSPPSKAELTKQDVKDEDKLICPTDVESRNTSNVFMFDTDTSGGGDSGTEKEQVAFIMELHKFHKERGLDFKPPKFYGVPLNLLKLWRAVLKLGGYDTVTSCKYWRQVGESFKPPRTCTTISFTFRIFYEKALLEYERYRRSAEGSGLPASLSVPMVAMDAENQALGSGRARRDAASRAMQGWHSHRILDNGEVSDPITKDKSSVSLNKKEKPLKSLDGILKRNIPSSTDDAVTPAHKLPKIHSDATVIDIGSPADWVKINVRATRDCYEVYALVPGLLREEVRVQSDPAGRLVISGEPENPDNPWNVTPFKKVVSLPSRIDPHQTSAVVTLHGQLFVRVPFEHYD